MINRNRYAGDKIIRASDLKDDATYTIDWFEEIETQLRDRKVQPSIKLHEFEHNLPLNTTNLDVLLDAFGNDEEKWKGKKVRVSLVDSQTPEGNYAVGIRLYPVKEGKAA